MLPGGGGGGIAPPPALPVSREQALAQPPRPALLPRRLRGMGGSVPPGRGHATGPHLHLLRHQDLGDKGWRGCEGQSRPPTPLTAPPLNPSTHPQLRPQQDLAAGTPPGQREPAVQCQPLGGQELGQGQAEGTQGLPPLLLHLRGTGGSAPRDGTPTAGTGPLPWGQDPRCEDGAETCSSSDSTWGRLMRKEKPSSHTGSADGVQVWGYKSG